MHSGEILYGPDIYLRDMTLADVTQSYVDWLNNPQIVQYLPIQWHPQNFDTIRSFVSSTLESTHSILFAICLQNSHRHIGNLKLGPISDIHRCADLSFLIGEPQYFGLGYATQAVKLAIDFAFDHLKLNRVQAGYYVDHEASRKIFRNLNFTVEGLRRQALKSRSPSGFSDLELVGLLREDTENEPS